MKEQILDRPIILKNQKVGPGSPNVRMNESGELIVTDFDCGDLKPELEKLKVLKSQFVKGKWNGEDVGSESDPITHLHSRGEFKGFRLQNFDGMPQSSAKNVGRMIFNSKNEKVYCDLGYKFKRVSFEKFEVDILVSDPFEKIEIDLKGSDIDDARKTIWQVCYNSEDFARVLNAKIKTPSEKSVVIELPEGSQIGTYRILGVE